jgi:hypothetical protein
MLKQRTPAKRANTPGSGRKRLPVKLAKNIRDRYVAESIMVKKHPKLARIHKERADLFLRSLEGIAGLIPCQTPIRSKRR